jgi:REP element-mobilizing transposase RayT/DNA-binding response OmpR family regulator
MSNRLLVITTDIPFGELIRECLEETGRFTVHVTRGEAEAKAYLRETDCSAAFLDPGEKAGEVLAIGRHLWELRPDLRFVVIAEDGQQVTLEELSPLDYLSKPFYLPDLIETVNKLFPTTDHSPEKNEKGKHKQVDAPPWLSDVTRAAQHLTRLTLESSAQAALITRDDQLWAYAGQLPQSAAHELADAVTRYWDYKEESDLVRFVRLTSTNAEHMLYATRLAPGMVLALVFDAETPFSTIRSQANQLVRALSISPVAEDTQGEEAQLASLSDILSDVPPPDPSPRLSLPQDSDEISAPTRLSQAIQEARKLFSSTDHETDPETPLKRRNRVREGVMSQFSHESSPAMPLNRTTETDEEILETKPHLSAQTEDELAVTVKSKAAKKKTGSLQQDPNDTLPHSITEVARKMILEPVSPAVYNLDYACLLIPRFIHHHLTGDLSERLGEWIPEICIAFGWRLEYISIRPEHLQWIVNVPPATSPGYLMRILRQHTSEKIFADFPRYSKENPSGDFWAPGYLIMGGSQPPPAQLIKDFIAQTRRRQGFSPQTPR